MSERKHSALYRYVERIQGDRPWGAVLDAGTGVNSLSWLTGLETDRWTAVTGSIREANWVRGAIKTAFRSQDKFLEGNWADPDLLQGEAFDTVLADYLLGAIDGFAPYFQQCLFQRLRPLTRGRLYVTGLEPYVPTLRPETKAGQLIWEIGRYRDACVLLSGQRPYREYPAQWVVDNLARSGFAVQSVKHFKISYKKRFVNAQIDLVLPGLEKHKDRTLVDALKAHGEALRAEALALVETEGALKHCRNYVIVAEPV
ncbi:MAG: hypothetical protein JJ850_07475 [Kordiimonadaceae bacterium]|nr:hypothetical protein [Kordiimonadaceae bacterium]MBO6567829.1 hypothetical protein [Kordiimonadaceae bacterium]MBO6964441.1 hypothetical protein [Kordiimonadaceae bacterium]